MTIAQALQSLNTYPVDALFIEKVGIDRGLDITADYVFSEAYELATADIYMYLSTQPSISEQETSINNAISVKKAFADMANEIYGKYGDDKYTGIDYGFNGEDY